MDRTELLLSKEIVDKVKKSTVLVVGVGGVGGAATEALARLHVGTLILIDHDVVEDSNRNRQIIALKSTLGKAKVDVFKGRINDIYDDIKVITFHEFYDEKMNDTLNQYSIDFIVDAIDSTKAKWELIKYAYNEGIPSISVLGMGNKKDPSLIKISNLEKTEVDPLAKKIRDYAKKEKYNLRKIKVVYSNEVPVKNNTGIISSSMIVPASAGLLAAKAFLDSLEGGK